MYPLFGDKGYPKAVPAQLRLLEDNVARCFPSQPCPTRLPCLSVFSCQRRCFQMWCNTEFKFGFFICLLFKISNSLVQALKSVILSGVPGSVPAAVIFLCSTKGWLWFRYLQNSFSWFLQDICKPNELVIWFNISQKYSRGDFCLTKACSNCRKTKTNEGRVWNKCTKARVL